MKTTSAFLCCFFLLIPALLVAQAPQRVLPIDSPVYDLVDAMYSEQGMVHSNMARPWTAGEAASLLEEVEVGSLSPAGAAAYDEASRLLDWRPSVESGDFSFRGGIELTVETFNHINQDQDAAALEVEYEWQHGYEERKPLLYIPLELGYGDSLFLETGIDAREERNAVSGPIVGSALPSAVLSNRFNLLFDDADPWLDLYFPFKALLSTGGDWWNLRFGRDKLSWGNGHSGNMMLSDYSDFYDFIGLSLYSRVFKLTNIYAVMDAFYPYGSTYPNVKDSIYSAFLGHRLDIRPWDRLLISINESVVFGKKQPELLRDLNFLMIFHNWMIPERSNSLMSVEVSFNPWKYLNLYGQVAMDEFATEYEQNLGGGGGPPIFGYLAGIKSDLPLGPGYFTLVGEWALTSPWLYNRRAPPYYYNVRRYWSLVSNRTEYVVKPLGYQYGSDAVVWYAEAGYAIPGSWKVGLDLSWVATGEKGVGETWNPAPGDLPPTGIVERLFVAHLGAEYPAAAWLSLGADLYYADLRNRANVSGAYSRDLEITCYARVKR